MNKTPHKKMSFRNAGGHVCPRTRATVVFLLLAVVAQASDARSVTLPHTESFDSQSSISDIAWVTEGATVTWLPTLGWRGGGATKITPPNTVNQGYGGVGSFDGFSTTSLNVRWLMNFGSSYATKTPGTKTIIMNRNSTGIPAGFEAFRPMLLENGNNRNGEETKWWYPCLQIECTMYNPNDRLDQPLELTSTQRINEWISFELEADLVARRVNLYIHTQDGQVSGLYASHDMATATREPSNSADYPIVMVQGIGFFWGAAVVPADANTYVLIDEVKMDSRYVGPPAGFLSDPPPAAPTNLRSSP